MLGFFESRTLSAFNMRRFPSKNSVIDFDFINNRGYINGTHSDAFSQWTVTRGTTKRYFDAGGNMQTAAINTGAVDYNPVNGRCRGFSWEPTRSNLLLNSLIDKTPLSTQSVTVTAVEHCLSFYGTGSIELSGVHTATLAGLGDTSQSSIVFTPTAGTLTLTVTGSVFWAQLEVGDAPSSFIPTASTAVSRSADTAVCTALSGLYNTEGTLFAEIAYAKRVPTALAVQLDDGTSNNRVVLGPSSTGLPGCFVRVGGGTTLYALGGVVMPGQGNIVKLAFAYRTDYGASACNGNPCSTDDAGAVPASLTRIASQPLNGWITRLTYLNKALSLSDMVGATR